MTTPHLPVAIVGGGPTGVSAAILLAQRGVRCIVIDRWDGVYPQPRAVHLDDEVCRILDRMGVADDFAAISRPALGLQVIDTDHRVLARFERDRDAGLHGYPQANLFDQPELEQILRGRLAELSPARLCSGTEVTRIDVPDAPSPVTLHLRDRASGELTRITADYVLGCDGANSLVRSTIGSAMEDLGFEQRWLVVDVETDRDLRQWEGVHQLSDRHRAGTYMRVGDRRYRWEFQLLPGETAADYATMTALGPLLAPWTGELPVDDFQLLRAAEYTFRAQLADRWRSGPVFLLGDAAHLTPPFVGQGMCSGLRDAANLSWKLAGVIDGSLPADALDSYEVERKPHARAMIKLAMLIGFAMTGGGAAGDAFRRLALPRASLVPGLRRTATDSATPRLGRSALVRRGRLAGRLMPSAVVSGSTRLDLLCDGFAVVTLDEPTPGERALLRSRGIGVVHVAAESGAGRWLSRGRSRAALVRPDRTVLSSGRSISIAWQELPSGSA